MRSGSMMSGMANRISWSLMSQKPPSSFGPRSRVMPMPRKDSSASSTV